MKKILLTVLCSLMVVFTVNAQALSGNEVVDGMLKETDTAALEEEFARLGVKSQIRCFYDSKRNELVFSYRFFNPEVYEKSNINESLVGAISGMVKAVMTEENSGNYLIWMGNEFKRTNTGMRVECLYKDQKKEASATADKIQEIIYKLFQ